MPSASIALASGTLWDADKTDLVLFLKPTTSYLPEGSGPIMLPPGLGEVHHEIELALVVGERARRVAPSEAMRYVGGYAVAIDLTARDMQLKAKKVSASIGQVSESCRPHSYLTILALHAMRGG